MIRTCKYCGYINNNYFICSGCGRELRQAKKEKFEKLPESSTIFLNEVKKSIDKVFSQKGGMTPSIEFNSSGLSISDISKESGILLIDNSQWHETDSGTKKTCFYGEILTTYILSLFLSLTAAFAISAGVTIFLKLFFASYILIAILLWFIFPFMFGVTAFAFVSHGCGLFKDSANSVKNSTVTLLVLFVMVMFYSFLPVFLIEYFLASKFSSYIPVAMKVAGVDYLMKTGGD